MKKVLIILLVLGLIGGGIGVYLWNKPHRTAENEKPVATLTAEDLFLKFSTDEKTAMTDYLDKTIEVKGTINAISTNETGDTKITLATSHLLAEISCLMKNGTDVSGIQTGTEIVIKGICIGYDTDVQLQQSVIIKK